ncbi:MAG: phosphotransferase family protein [Candidatus Binatus sp.]|uniref:phosphotransferase family protein n=1 Tax=Candidatus Binatus sp. TaxID=2811406 RepID=UPI0027172F01|nr:phosphotransferase family protein [Candidatus Binatus sp.]MDO8432129.1 phosphotransferase family protein [Candidatus Binatus sp.]
MAANIEQVTAQLTRLVRAKTGDPGASAHSLETLPGHAGFSYSFILERSTPTATPAGKFVVRMAAPAVKISGPADIQRQARIMASLAGTRVPVPPVLWHGDEPEFFDRPYFVVGFLDGFKLGESMLPRPHLQRLARKGVETMAALHNLPWQPRVYAFGEPFPLSEEMKRLDYLLDRPTLDPAVVARAPELRERLRSSLPDNARIGCVHGDFQWSNVLFNEERPVCVIDWEIALCGATLLDLGWICFFSDPASWVNRDLVATSPLSADEIVDTYAAATGFPVSRDEVNWFRSFAGYRFGVITCFNLMLHRRGKREDPQWEETALSAPRMFEHGLEMLG